MAEIEPVDWMDLGNRPEMDFTCGWCNRDVSSTLGATPVNRTLRRQGVQQEFGALRACPRCGRPTFFGDGRQYPGARHGDVVNHLPDELAGLYGEAGTASRSTRTTRR